MATSHPAAMEDASAEPFEWLSLDDNESVVWSGEPHWASQAQQFIWGVLLLPFLGFGLLLILPAYLTIKNTDFVITTTGVYEKRGILSESIENLDHDRIQNTTYEQSFVERQLGVGSVGISTAGSAGTQITLESIEGAREVQDLLGNLGDQHLAAEAETETDDRDGATLDDVAADIRATREALEAIEEAVREQGSD